MMAGQSVVQKNECELQKTGVSSKKKKDSGKARRLLI